MRPEIHLVGLPFDQKSSFLRGAADAPAAIRKVLHSGASNYLTENGIHIQEDLSLIDHGDVTISSYLETTGILKNQLGNKFCKTLYLGGDHSVTYPIVKYLSGIHQEPFDILHFDAHTDLYHEYCNDPYSHACPFARIMEEKLVNRLIQVGIRTVSAHQQAQAERFEVQILTMGQLENWKNQKFSNPVYVSLDLDVFDPGFAPGVSHHEPGGVSPRFVMDCINSLSVPVVSADIVELNPSRDFHEMTAALAVKMLKEIVGKMADG